MEIKIDTEKTVEQIASQMWEIVGRLATRCAFDIATGTAYDAESILRDPVVQKDFLRYDKLITLVESVKPPDERTEKHKASLLKAANGETASNLFERLINLAEKKPNCNVGAISMSRIRPAHRPQDASRRHHKGGRRK